MVHKLKPKDILEIRDMDSLTTTEVTEAIQKNNTFFLNVRILKLSN